MNRETALAGGALALLALVVVAIAVAPGVMAETEEPVRPSVTELRSDAPPAVVGVAGDTATLQIDTRLVHRGGLVENVTLEVRAVDAETGLLADRVVSSVGSLSGEREARVLTNLTLDREGGYRVETILYEDGRRLESGTRRISGVGSLRPGYARSPIEFQRFEGFGVDLPTITYTVESVESGQATLGVSAAVTNTGGEQTGDVQVVIRARQADSNVIADRATVDLADVRPGRTVSSSVELTVPDDYNYWLDATIVADGVVVDTAIEPANLDPEETIEANRTQREVEFDTGDFEEGTDEPRDAPREPEATSTDQGPGFGVTVTVLAVIGALVIATRRHHQ